MKKFLLAVSTVILLIAVSSCEKRCTCKYYEAGKVVDEKEFLITKESDKKCSDFEETPLSTDINGKKTGMECK